MSAVHIKTQSAPYVLTNSTNSTATSITEPVPTTTKPSGDGYIEIGPGEASNGLRLIPFGAGSDDNTMLMAVYGWAPTIGAVGSTVPLWVPTLLASFTCTLSTATGAAGGTLGTTARFADTIVVITGNANVSYEIVSPAADSPAHIMLDAKGCHIVGFLFSRNSSATSCNCLAALL